MENLNRATQGKTVLIVEDDVYVRSLIVRTLRKQGYRIIEATSAENGLAAFLASRYPIDLLIADMLLPGMSGLDLAAEVERRQPGLRILYTSGCLTSIAIEVIAMQRPEALL